MTDPIASTAYGPMVLVALERTFPPAQRIIDDPFAYRMLPLYMRMMVKSCQVGFIRRAMYSLMDKQMPGLILGFACRKRYLDEKTADALQNGIESAVILGAGLDTLAYRTPGLSGLRVYEVDMPENIDYKRKRLKAIFGAVPAHVTLVPTNFEDGQLEASLKAAGYRFDQKTMFVWEAVTQYLTEDAVRGTFELMAKAAPGSRLVFTYVVRDFVEGVEMYGLDALYKRFRVDNDYVHFGLHPQEVAEFIEAYGWQVLEDVTGGEFSARYLQPAGREEPMTEIEHAVYAEKSPGE